MWNVTCSGVFRILEMRPSVEHRRRELLREGRGAAGAERGLGTGEGDTPSHWGWGLGRGLCPLSTKFFNFLNENGVF